MLDHDQLDAALAASPSPNRITLEYMKSRIQNVHYIYPDQTGGTMTICIIALDNGFTVTGESACVDPTNFNKEVGETYAYKKAEDKLWPLFGFALKEKMVAQKTIAGNETKTIDVVTIARVCHEANRAIALAAGDTSIFPWEKAEEWQRQTAINGVKRILQNPATTYAESHETWAREKLDAGWTYGSVKDAEKKTHPCLVPHDQLPYEKRVIDYVFVEIVHAMVG